MKSGRMLKPETFWFELILCTSVHPKSSEWIHFFASPLCAQRGMRRQLLGRPTKAEKTLGWKRQVDFDSLIKEMVEADLKASKSLIEDQN
jgi:nucleoside-diphosphate-sugar epimerase